jgi:hypothetical protein
MKAGSEFTYNLDTKLTYKFTGKVSKSGIMKFDVYYNNFRGRMYCGTQTMHRGIVSESLTPTN